VLLRRPCPVTVGWSGIAPIVLLGGLFGLIAAQVGAPVVAAALVGAVCGPLSLVVHELGHLGIARKVDGVRPIGVSLMWGGAATRLEGRYLRGRDQIMVALAGPAASIALAAALIPAFHLPLPLGVRDVVLLLLLFNVVVALVNLIPVEPLDGYKVVVGLLWSTLGSEASARRLIRRAAFGGLAVEALTALVLLAEKPVLGSTSIAIAGGLYGQKFLVRRARRPTHS
jgi:stage IV sporulation protein FB